MSPVEDSQTACPLPDSFWQGVTEFNRGDFYACHDTLEAIWMVTPVAEKSFYQGILQISVGLYHLSNHNWQGAAVLLGEGSYRLRDYDSEYGGVDLEDLLARVAIWLNALQQSGPERVSAIARALIQGDPDPSLTGGVVLPRPEIRPIPSAS